MGTGQEEIGKWETFVTEKRGTADRMEKLKSRRIACSQQMFPPLRIIVKGNSPFSAVRRDFIAVKTAIIDPEAGLQRLRSLTLRRRGPSSW